MTNCWSGFVLLEGIHKMCYDSQKIQFVSIIRFVCPQCSLDKSTDDHNVSLGNKLLNVVNFILVLITNFLGNEIIKL